MGRQPRRQTAHLLVRQETRSPLAAIAPDAQAGVGALRAKAHGFGLPHDDGEHRHGPVGGDWGRAERGEPVADIPPIDVGDRITHHVHILEINADSTGSSRAGRSASTVPNNPPLDRVSPQAPSTRGPSPAARRATARSRVPLVDCADKLPPGICRHQEHQPQETAYRKPFAVLFSMFTLRFMRADKPVFAGPLEVHLFRTVEPSGVREGIRLPSGGITAGCDVGSFPPFPLQRVSPPLGTTRQGIEVSVRIGDDAPHVLSPQWMLAVAFKVSWLV